MNNKKRITQTEITERLRKIEELLLSGAARDDVIQYASQNWSIGKRQTDAYIGKVNTRLKLNLQKDLVENYNWHLEARKKLLLKCILKEKYGVALEILKDIAKLQGLVDDKPLSLINVYTQKTEPLILNDPELKEQLWEIKNGIGKKTILENREIT